MTYNIKGGNYPPSSTTLLLFEKIWNSEDKKEFDKLEQKPYDSIYSNHKSFLSVDETWKFSAFKVFTQLLD